MIFSHPAPRQPQVSIAYHTPGEFIYPDDAHTQYFAMAASSPATLLTQSGMQFHIPAGAFKGAHGDLQVAIKELCTSSEVLCFGRPTTANGALLETAVQFQIQAFQEGQLLELVQPLQVRIPVSGLGEKSQRLLAFSGDAAAIRPLSGQQIFDWKYTSGLMAVAGGAPYRQFSIDRCGWWACQKAHPSKARRTMLSARMTGNAAAFGNLEALLLFKDSPAMVRMYPGVHGFAALNVPEGLQVAALVFGMFGDELFAGRSAWENSSGRILNVPVNSLKKEAFREMVEGVFFFQRR